MPFLLTDLIERWRNDGFSVAPYERKDDAPSSRLADLVHSASAPLDDGRNRVIGEVIPAAAAFPGSGLHHLHAGGRGAAAAVGLHRWLIPPAQPAGPWAAACGHEQLGRGGADAGVWPVALRRSHRWVCCISGRPTTALQAADGRPASGLLLVLMCAALARKSRACAALPGPPPTRMPAGYIRAVMSASRSQPHGRNLQVSRNQVMKRIVHALLPTPVLSIALLVLWLLLNRSMSAGHILRLGTLLALAIPRLTAGLRRRSAHPQPARLRSAGLHGGG